MSDILPLKRTEGQDFLALEHPVAPIKSFPTPILQLASFQFPAQGLDTFLGVRTFGSTALLRIRPSSDRSTLNISESAFVVRDDVGQRPPIDIKFHSRQPDMLLVNDEGGVYKCGLKNGQKSVKLGTKFMKTSISCSIDNLYMLQTRILMVAINSGNWLRLDTSRTDVCFLPVRLSKNWILGSVSPFFK